MFFFFLMTEFFNIMNTGYLNYQSKIVIALLYIGLFLPHVIFALQISTVLNSPRHSMFKEKIIWNAEIRPLTTRGKGAKIKWGRLFPCIQYQYSFCPHLDFLTTLGITPGMILSHGEWNSPSNTRIFPSTFSCAK